MDILKDLITFGTDRSTFMVLRPHCLLLVKGSSEIQGSRATLLRSVLADYSGSILA